MPIFKIKNKTLYKIEEQKIKLERELQEITERNLEPILGLEFISTEFSLKNLRIDTLAIDNETKSFVIIEYKRGHSFSVIDQGFAYLSLMLENKPAFILEYNENNDKNLKRTDIDWEQSRVIFIANDFTSYQQKAINFQDLPIELWKVQMYDNNLINYHKLENTSTSASIKNLNTKKIISRVTKEIKKYTINDHFHKGWNNSRDVFENINEKILNLDGIFINPVKFYIGYKINNSLLIDIKIRKSKLILELLRTQPKDLKDPEKRTYYSKNSFEYFNQHITNFDINNNEDIDYAMFLIKQLYKKFKDKF